MSMDIIERLGLTGIVPVVVLEDAERAVPTARALLAGGIDVMEITFRTSAAPEAIRAVAEQCPEMTVGAGTVVTLEQCRQALACGAQFIVSPGYCEEVVTYCVAQNIAVLPGCVTPTEIMAAMAHGLHTLKFFPANVYGGLAAMKALSGPFPGVRFIPTGGVSAENLGEFAAAPFVHAVGGSWLCAKADIAAGNYDKITALCREARERLLGFEVGHLGINTESGQASAALCDTLGKLFAFPVKNGNSSNFSGDHIEVMKSHYLGEKGHIAVLTNSIPCAIEALRRQGVEIRPETAKYKNGRLQAVYIAGEYGGFAVHLVQR